MSREGKIRVIGVNKAYREIKDSNEWIHATWFGDTSFYETFRRMKERNLYSFSGIKAGCCPHCHGDPAIMYFRRDRQKGPGITGRRDSVSWNKNSGGSAINFAYHLGGPNAVIFLFGFDLKRDKNEESHWHNGYSEDFNRKNKNVGMPFNKWKGTHETIARDAKHIGLKIYNVNPGSAIDCYEKIDFEQFLKMVDEDSGVDIVSNVEQSVNAEMTN